MEQKEVTQIARKLGRTLVDSGVKMLKSAFKLTPSVYSKADMQLFLNGLAFPSTSLSDEKYYVVGLEDWKNIIAQDWIGEKKYMVDVFDCQVPVELAWAWGLFFSDGSCSLNREQGYGGAGWRIVNSDLGYLERAREAFKWEYKDKGLDFIIKSFPSYRKGNKTNYWERKKTL